VGVRTQRLKRTVQVARVARRSKLTRVLREIGVVGERPATEERAVEFRRGLEELGTTYVKLGQLLSSRSDLLPDVYIEELTKLVDDAPPVPFDQIERTIDAEIGRDAFAGIERDPLASASIAQVHGALLADGREVVVKVRRPGVLEQVDVDLDVLRSTVKFLHRHSETAQLLQLEALADELEVHLRGELDLGEEAHNTELVAQTVEEFPELTVPRVIRPHVTEKVLVLERVRGKKFDARHGVPRAGGTAGALVLPRLHPPGHR
jgi:ubiquinone biosynthesis protein